MSKSQFNGTPILRNLAVLGKDKLLNELTSLRQVKDEVLSNQNENQVLIHNLEVYQIELEIQNRELLESHQSLLQLKNQYIDLYDYAPVGYLTLDGKGFIRQANLTAASLLRSDTRNLINKPLNKWLAKTEQFNFFRHLSKCREAKDSEVVVSDLIFDSGKDEQRLYVQLHSVVVADFSTGAKVYRTSLIDVTEKRRAEAAEALSKSLEAQRKTREYFVSTLAHDLRTPLTGILFNTQLLLRNNQEPCPDTQLLKRTLRNVRRMDRMISNLLDANRIEAGQTLNLKMGECDVVALSGLIIEDFSENYRCRILLKVKTPVVSAWCDSDVLRRSIENLLTNAFKYGSVNAPVSLTLESIDHVIRISVHNEGSYLTPEEQTVIFSPHRNTRVANADFAEGWGIGLTLVKGATEALGGQVTVQSSKELGTVFTMDIPSHK